MEAKISKNQILVRACCIIISFILWLYIFNVENPMRERKISVPVKIVNETALTRSNLIKVGDDNYKISLDVKGNASEVFSINPDDFELECDLSSYVMKKGKNNVPVKVKKRPKNISILNEENLWMTIELDDIFKKTVPVKLIIEGETKNGLHAVNPVLNIKNAQISGPSSIVYNLNYVVARYNIKNISKNTKVKVALEAEDSSGTIVKNVNISPKYVNIDIPVAYIKSVPVQIKTVGKIQDNMILRSVVSLPDKVYVSGERKLVSSLDGLDTEPLDLSPISSSRSVDVKLIIPDGIKLVNSNGYVNLKVEVTKSGESNGVEEKSFNLNIEMRNLNNNYTAQLSNNSSSIVVSGNESILSNLSENDISCFIDLSSVSQGEESVPLNVILPEGVSLISKNPQNVKVIISKKTSEGENAN
ncbi:MAG: CdaR family protein [Clostridium sp.]|jgi:YbbR domain-containing protein|uniref:CdaR family protein n=1 Tax=Clostridium sp. TaxID=1506 RepID=UPI0025C514FD|nr:CdaR family protein [Clostridium sp.]MCH3965722.1 CdaR family protein [Clostridium sp.]MCI1717098.1 CdaR family protein [Clostridium sp.]MCI1801365.1 CdaR family protein [Clostridium sp.]MCI1815211.1 CdaR family protein [Clostridium sp.]MCI1872114.1 CdaR family protein [Clostridium sp.]